MPDSPPLDTLDADLAALQEAAGRLAVTLMSLDGDPTRAMLEHSGGQTAARWQAAAADLATAWAAYPQLSGRVDALLALRGTDRRPGRDVPARLAAALRDGIDLAAGGADAATCARLAQLTPPPEGGAAGGADPAHPDPARLAEALRVLLAGVAGTIADFRRSRDELLSRVDASGRALDELRRTVDGALDSPAGRAAADRLTALTEAAGTDPLGVTAADFDALDESIADCAEAGSSAEALRAHLSERLDEGRALLAALPALVADARAARDLAAVKILRRPVARPGAATPAAVEIGRRAAAGSPGPATPDPAAADPLPEPDELRALAGELAALEALAAAGHWRRLAARRPAWAARLDAATAQATAVRDRCRAQLAHRDELRGRLRAYRAKAQAYRLAEDPELTGLADRAEETLYLAPCDLDAAAAQVDAYTAAVRAATAPTPRTPAG
jgi:hypothetical protein